MNSTAIIERDGTLEQSGYAGSVPWWSFTKTALAIVALHLVEDGTLTLDAPLENAPYTLRQLLRHEAGLPDYGALPHYHTDVAARRSPWSVEHLLAETKADELLYQPGAGWSYSNIGYFKIARLIADGFPGGLAAALDKFLFGPANLTSARLAVTPTDLANVEMGNATGYHPGWVYHGLITGTVADAAQLLWHLANDRLLKPDTRAEMLKGHDLPQFRSATHPDPAYGLGLMCWTHDPDEHPFGHGGEGPGSGIAVYALNKRVAAIWTTLPSDMDVTARAFQLLG